MNEVNIKVTGGIKLNPVIFVDGKQLKVKKNQFGSLQATYTTDKDTIELSICKYLELSGKFWFLFAILFFIISIFGILNPFYDRKCIVIDSQHIIKLKEKNDVNIIFKNMVDQGQAVEIKTENEVEEIKNIYYVDKKVKKWWLILIITEVCVWVAIIITAITLLVSMK